MGARQRDFGCIYKEFSYIDLAMSYNRGGKVWVDSNTYGWVALEQDWDGGSLPQDLVSESGLIGTDFKLVDPMTRADIAGYAKVDDQWLFFSELAAEFHRLQEVSIFYKEISQLGTLAKIQIIKGSGRVGAFLDLRIIEWVS